MVTLALHDTLELDDGDGLEIVDAAGHELAVDDGEDNLVRRALRASDRRAHVRLIKRIGAGAGLGGGSADAAAILRWAGVTDLRLAATIGADVPFCLVGGRARVGGIGELIEPLPPVARTFTLLTPPFGCATPAVYAKWDELGGPSGDGPNDLEPAALAVERRLAQWRDRLGDATGEVPVLAGSGSTWFVEGAFPGDGRVVTNTVAV
jgi:4-diphosphocytidyl-2-C-methyl-D-erythritol kinase